MTEEDKYKALQIRYEILHKKYIHLMNTIADIKLVLESYEVINGN